MPTLRQKKAIQNISENLRNGEVQPMGQVLKNAGYSESVSKKPQLVTQSKGWKKMMEEVFPDQELLSIHKKLLQKQEIVRTRDGYKKTGQPHSDAKYALELIYKLKGKLNKDFQEEEERPLEDLTERELFELMSQDRMVKSILKEIWLEEGDNIIKRW